MSRILQVVVSMSTTKSTQLVTCPVSLSIPILSHSCANKILCTGSGKGFKEEDEPNYLGSTYSWSKVMAEKVCCCCCCMPTKGTYLKPLLCVIHMGCSY